MLMLILPMTCRRLYYSDCSRSFPHIGICDMAVETCSTVTFGAPHGCVTSLTFDLSEQRVYWSDLQRGIISSADVTGKQIRPIRCVYGLLRDTFSYFLKVLLCTSAFILVPYRYVWFHALLWRKRKY